MSNESSPTPQEAGQQPRAAASGQAGQSVGKEPAMAAGSQASVAAAPGAAGQAASSAPANQEQAEGLHKSETSEAVPAGKPTQPGRRRTTVGSVIFDTLLVLILLAVLGYSAYYLHRELPKFRVPSPMELALEENDQLSQRYDELISQSHHAEVQLAMREKLAALDAKLASLEEQFKQGENRIAELKTQALGVQHEIRQADKEARAVALSLLPGLTLGDVATTTGKRFNNATIYRIENNARGKRIVLRSPEGQVSYPLNELVRDNLPQIFLYAFGLVDLVDMSDFSKADGTPVTAQSQTNPKPASGKGKSTGKTRKSRGVIIINGERYEIGGGSPVVDTEAAAKTPPAPSTDTMPVPDEIWQAPDGALPL